MTKDNDIHSKVIEVMKDKNLLIFKAGTIDGVGRHSNISIYETGRPIKDPDTGEFLGDLELYKVSANVAQRSEKFTVARYNPTNAVAIPEVGDKVVIKPSNLDKVTSSQDS